MLVILPARMRLAQMASHQRCNLFWPFDGERMRAAGDDHELCIRDPLLEELADSDGTDGIRVSEDEKCRRVELSQAVRDIGPIVHEPARHVGQIARVLGTPIGSAEPCDIDSPRGRNEHEAPNQLWPSERKLERYDTPHGLRHDVARPRESALGPCRKVLQRAHRRVLRLVSEPWPSEEQRVSSHAPGNRFPERGAPSRTGEVGNGHDPARYGQSLPTSLGGSLSAAPCRAWPPCAIRILIS